MVRTDFKPGLPLYENAVFENRVMTELFGRRVRWGDMRDEGHDELQRWEMNAERRAISSSADVGNSGFLIFFLFL
jgi:hypothetical protein